MRRRPIFASTTPAPDDHRHRLAKGFFNEIGRSDPFAGLSTNDRFLRFGGVRCVGFARRNPQAVTSRKHAIGFDPIGQTAKTARIEEPGTLVSRSL
jgi:hypothetical protein